MVTQIQLEQLAQTLEGTLLFDALHKTLYATDASAYRLVPLAVAVPKTEEDIKKIMRFATQNKLSITPRTAGTSLAGQTVGEGIIVDVSKHFTQIIAFDPLKKTVTVQPGVIRDELNLFLKPHGLFFGPNTSTSNRCMIGGMVGNNSSGTTSIRYGVTRDKIVEIKAVLSDSSSVVFNDMTSLEFIQKTKGESLENSIYKTLYEELSNVENQKEITSQFPKPEIHRRNTGYAIDILLQSDLFSGNEPTINLGKLLCGSEGTLAFTTEITLKVDDLPPTNNIMVVAHFDTIQESLESVLIAMKHHLYTCEMMDDTILDCTKNNREQAKNRHFIQGNPKAIMLFEVAAATKEEAENQANALVDDLQKNNFGYALIKLYDGDIDRIIELRKAGLGLLGSIVGDDKAADSIEDTAVELRDLPNYIAEFSAMMKKHGQDAIYYAHAGAGEIHLRPVLNLKTKEGVYQFRNIATEVALLVKKYRGSLSGEHGDGIVRGEFLPFMIGDKNYELLKRVKKAFDPNTILNVGKIVNAYKMDENLRFESGRVEPNIQTIQDFSDSMGILRAAEKCNGSGDCRKLPSAGGTLCPSYRATKNEKDTTRARANALREYLTHSEKENKFNHKELYDVFELCVSCKACASECPSNVDVAALKAEFLYQYQKANGFSFRNKMFAYNNKINQLGSLLPRVTNAVSNLSLVKKSMGIAPKREVPFLAKTTFRKWYKEEFKRQKPRTKSQNGKLYLFCDEFTNYYDVEVGIDAYELLTHLGYEVIVIDHEESARAFISKGFLDQAQAIANKNVAVFKDLISENCPLVGIEPSAILTFRDEYLRLAKDKEAAAKVAKYAVTMEEFFKNEIDKGAIHQDQFSDVVKTIKIHGHCHQKSLSSVEATFAMLNVPKNASVTIYNSGCCGMAGSFGYEKEHYDISMQMGEDTLFPKIRNTNLNTEIAAAGTSCRHQIFDGTNRKALHPVTILRSCLK
ncbi:FAD-binding and (Fe-S)-binding domain-containing protein [Flavobacterium restrictum]|uniref:FAD-binding protein n=1 Tax=Flavobacterium restrictum TaxID=2594428 RepID=A0A553EDD5_9FLAO|nr:FAD-binding and (Fe-S)-binding domain-containing protein [Flavobacterium restrictum]TRX43029.1 FAD-binding protein [Flavobacterium restrictum]